MDEFIKILTDNLPTPVLIILALIGIILFIFKDNVIKKFKSFKTNKTQKKDTSKKISKLEYHRFFNICDVVESKILNMHFETHKTLDKTKTKMMHTLIQLKCKSMKSRFGALLLTDGIDSWEHLKLQHTFKTTLGNVVKEYNQAALLTYISWGISHEDAEFLIETYEDYRANMVEGFVDSIDSVLMNKDYVNNFDKVNTLMELCCLAIFVIPRDVQSSFESVNGRFAKYNNLMI